MFPETFLDLLEDVFNLWSSGTTKLRDLGLRPSSSELKLPFTNLNEFCAPAHESVGLGEYRVRVKIPFGTFGLCSLLVDNLGHLLIDLLPFLPALDAGPEITHTLFHVAIKHVGDVDALFAPLNYLVGDLM